MKKILIIFSLIISLSACSKTAVKENKPSIYKKAIGDSKQIQININKEIEINQEAIK